MSPDYRGIKIALEAAALLGAESPVPGSASHPVLCIVLPTCLVAGKVSSSNLPHPHPAAGRPASIDSLPQAFLLLSCSCGIKAASGLGEGGLLQPSLPEETFPAYQHFLTAENSGHRSVGK